MSPIPLPIDVKTYQSLTLWRSSSYGQAITMDDYEHDFLTGDEKTRKLAVKRLTRKIDLEMKMSSVNAPDWCVSI